MIMYVTWTICALLLFTIHPNPTCWVEAKVLSHFWSQLKKKSLNVYAQDLFTFTSFVYAIQNILKLFNISVLIKWPSTRLCM